MIGQFCTTKFCITYPIVILLFVPLVFVLIFIINKTFVKFKNEKEKEENKKANKTKRVLMIVSMSLMLLALLIAISSPYKEKETTIEGNPSLTILADNSSSFDLFDKNIAPELKNKLESKIPVALKYIATKERSSLGDGILNNMQGDDNLLIVSDGNNNYGRDLGDTILFASMLNTTISMLDMQPIKKDVSIRIDGSSEVIVDTENSYYVNIDNIGNLDYSLDVTVDGEPINIEDNSFKLKLGEGYHKIIGKISVDDYFEQNNIFYKTVKMVQRPRILLVSHEYSPLEEILSQMYDLHSLDNIPDDLSGYSALIIDDLKIDEIKNRIDLINDFVADKGNGLVVVGGVSSFDRGYYKGSLFENMLPVTIGRAEAKGESDTNIIIVLDISESTGIVFGSGSENKKIDVEKALALSVISDIRKDDKVGVVAFNHNSYLVAPLLVLRENIDIYDKIPLLVDAGGTLVSSGLRRAEFLLRGAKGSKNIIVISDGITQLPDDAYNLASILAKQGIKIFTVGVGETTNREFMQNLARIGQGLYFEPSESQNIKILFGEPEPEEDKGIFGLVTLDSSHFITKDIKLGASVTGFNYGAVKPASRLLISTSGGNPILSVWRYGIGRVVAFTTDDGNKWSGQIFAKDNSKLIARMVNWAIGDLSRNKVYDVSIKDTNIGKETDVNVVASSIPSFKGLEFSKVDANLYSAGFQSEQTGFHEVLDAVVAVNYNDEYQELGINPKLKDLITATGGRIFDPTNIDSILEGVKTMSQRTKTDAVYYRWPFALIAIFLFLVEIAIRRIQENKNLKMS